MSVQPPSDRSQKPREKRRRVRVSGRAGAFTLVELLVVMAIIAVLAALLMPALSSAKSRSRLAACGNNLKQLALAVQLYAADNEGRLVENQPAGQGMTNWVAGSMRVDREAVDPGLVRQGKLYPYAGQAALFHCPADTSTALNLLRVRSYAMNGWMGSRFYEKTGEPGYRTFVRDAELAAAGPARLWVILDEHEASIDDGWFPVTMNDSQPFSGHPALRHEHGYGLNFADGHVEAYKVRDPESELLGSAGARFSSINSDWIRLKQATTVR